jgi:hypothetical protein
MTYVRNDRAGVLGRVSSPEAKSTVRPSRDVIHCLTSDLRFLVNGHV